MENITETSKKIKYLIADTTAFINAVPLNEYAENVLTVSDVVAEVRNKRQIRRLCVLPYDLQVREPSTESMRHCVEFAKKTGDYASLSGIDLKVIALTYELEATNVGTEHLRTQPVLSQVIASKEKPVEFADNTKLAGWYNPKGNADGSNSESEDDEYESDLEDSEDKVANDLNVKNQNDDNSAVQIDTVKAAIEKMLNNNEQATDLNVNLNEQDDVTEQELEQLFEKLKCEPIENDQSCDILIPEHASNTEDPEEATDSDDSAESNEQKADNAAIPDEQEDDGDWITPANIKKVKKSLKDEINADIVPLVACMSTDYAVQNVLKQMNLHIAALNGRIIKQLRTYILRCYACYKTTSIMTKVFCPNCGNKTLKRVAVSLDENGKQVIHINTRRPLTSKYKNQSIPRFRGGKHSHNPILFEDQPIPRQMPSRVAKTKTNALDEDYIAGVSPFVMRDVDSKSAMLRSKGHVKEWARNNTYEEDRRKKNYNRLYK